MNKWVVLFLAGGVGTITRYILSSAFYETWGTRFPFGTLIVNLLGCFLIGFLAAISQEKFPIAPELRLLFMVGFIGAFTTFSTFIYETSDLIKGGETAMAFYNVFLSVIVGFLLFRLGVLFASGINTLR